MQKPYATNRQHHQLWNYVDKAAAATVRRSLRKKGILHNTLLLIVCVHLLHQNCKSRLAAAQGVVDCARGGSPMQNLLLF